MLEPWADEFQDTIVAVPERKELPKRALLSQLNRIFDSLGFLSPVFIRGKIFLRQLWSDKKKIKICNTLIIIIIIL